MAMGAALTDQQLAAIETRLDNDPQLLQRLRQTIAQYQANYRSPRTMPSADYYKTHPTGTANAFKSVGIDFPDAEDYRLVQGADGKVHFQRDNWFQRNADWFVPVTTIGGGALVGALAPAATAPATTAPAAAATPPAAAALPAAIPPVLETLPSRQTTPTSGDLPPGQTSPGLPTSSNPNPTTPNIPRTSIPSTGDPTTDALIQRLLGGSSSSTSPDLLSLLLGLGGSAINALGNAFGQQHRQSFKGTAADPVDLLSGVQHAIGDEQSALWQRQQNPATAPPPPGAGALPTFTGGGLPMPIGVRAPASSQSLTTRTPTGPIRRTGPDGSDPNAPNLFPDDGEVIDRPGTGEVNPDLQHQYPMSDIDHLYASLSLLQPRRYY